MKIWFALCLALWGVAAFAQEEEEIRLEASARYEGVVPLEIALSPVRFSAYGAPVRRTVFQGAPLDDLQTDRTPWDALGTALAGAWAAERRSFDGAVETQEVDFSPFDQSAAGRAVAAVSNRTYTYRLGAEYTFSKNGWGFGVQAWRRWGRSFTTQGVWADAAGATLVGERRAGGHTVRLTLVVNPMERATASPSTAEAFDLMGDNLYNPAWGRWDGAQRSIRARALFEPILILNHTWQNLHTTLWVRAGEEARGGLTWQGAPNPMPDYWAALPSGQPTEALAEELRRAWRADPEAYGQLRFDRMVETNRSADRAHYMLDSRVRRSVQGGVESAWRTRYWSAGVRLAGAASDNFRRADDLLGGGYWLNVDQYVEMDDDVKELTQNDVRNPNARILAGDRYGYNYALNTFSASAFGSYGHWVGAWGWWWVEAEAGVRIDQRVGRYEKENFMSGRSYGASQAIVSPRIEVSIGGRWSGVSRWAVEAEATYLLRPPSSYDVFLSPETRNAASPVGAPYSVFGFTATTTYRSPALRASLTGWAGGTWGEGRVEDLYDDLRHTYVHFAMSNVATASFGAAAWAEYTVAPYWSLGATAVVSSRRYASNPTAVLFRQTTGAVVSDNQTVRTDGLHLGAGPETAGMLSVRYAPYGWVAQLSAVGYTGAYVVPAPTRRTFDALSKAATPQAMDEMTNQESLGGAVTLDLFAGRTWSLPHGSLGLYVGANNLLNNTSVRSTGYESARLRRIGSGYTPHASKYYYAPGTLFFVNLTYRF